MRILISCLTLGLMLSWGGASEAACGGSSPNRVAASVARADVNDCVTAAASGDTITVPAGSATWSSPIVLPGTKDLTITGSTVITCTGGTWVNDPLNCTEANNTTISCSTCWEVNLQATHIVSGFTMNGITDQGGIRFGGSYTSGKYFRFHHNRMVSGDSDGWARINVTGYANNTGQHLSGIFDHNVIVNLSLTGYGAAAQWDENCGDCQDRIWAQQPPLGQSGANVLVVERNHYKPTSNTNVIDGNHGQRTVFRFNRITGSSVSDVEWHGMQGDNRGPQLLEVYGNTSTTSAFSGTVFFRGGTGVVFHNARNSGISALLTNDRSELDDSIPVVGNCDGTRTGVDQNASGQQGWRCRDQVGVGYDTTKWTHGTSGGPFGAYAQVPMPVYLWGNTPGNAQIDSPGNVPLHIQANRDFYDHSTVTGSPQTVGVRSGPIASRPTGCTAGVAYWATDEGEWNSLHSGTDGRLYKCVATNTWALYYTPYPYPHPWTLGTGTGLGIPQNLRELK